MKYFEIQEAPESKYAPQLENWYGKFDVRDIKLELSRSETLSAI